MFFRNGNFVIPNFRPTCHFCH